jgi:hypothetical protein
LGAEDAAALMHARTHITSRQKGDGDLVEDDSSLSVTNRLLAFAIMEEPLELRQIHQKGPAAV